MATPPKRSRFKSSKQKVNPLTHVFSLLFAVLVAIIAVELARSWRAYQANQGASAGYSALGQKIYDTISKDLVSVGLMRLSCWQPLLKVNGDGATLELEGASGRFSTLLKTAANSETRYLHVANLAGAFGGMPVRLCRENLAENVVIDKTYSATNVKPDEKGNSDLTREGRFSFTQVQTGKPTLSSAFEEGALIQAVEQIKYFVEAGQLYRQSSSAGKQTVGPVQQFTVRNVQSGDDAGTLKFDFTIQPPGAEQLRQYSFEWKPWHDVPALNNSEAVRFLSRQR